MCPSERLSAGGGGEGAEKVGQEAARGFKRQEQLLETAEAELPVQQRGNSRRRFLGRTQRWEKVRSSQGELQPNCLPLGFLGGGAAKFPKPDSYTQGARICSWPSVPAEDTQTHRL